MQMAADMLTAPWNTSSEDGTVRKNADCASI